MFEKLIRFSIEQRWLVIVTTVAIACLGIANYSKLAIDAVPDITNVQVQVNTNIPGFTPLEVEQRITFPIETRMAGLPNLQSIRSISRYGLSQVTIIFDDGTDIYFARQLVSERIQESRSDLPIDADPVMGPISTGLGEIFMWSLTADEKAQKTDGSEYTSMDLREIQDWVIKPQLVTTPGVTEINTIGGYEKQFHITPYPNQLMAHNLNFNDIVNALLTNNNTVGAGFIERNGEQYLVRTPGQIHSISDIENIVIKTRNDVPIYLKDIAGILHGKELRTGAATQNGEEVILGTAFMLTGENSREVATALSHKIEVVRQSLPDGIQANIVYDRTHLVNKTIATVKANLFEGAILVIIVLFVFLGNLRAALLTALVIPLSMLFTVTGMVNNKVSANLMSLGALDFGIIVDGAVVIVENCLRKLSEEQKRLGRKLTQSERFAITFSASKEVRRALLFGQLIIIAVYIPLFSLTGIEGKMFTPMAFTVVTALIAAAILSVTFIPAAIAIVLRGNITERQYTWFTKLSNSYNRLLQTAINNTGLTLSLALSALLLSFLLLSRMGTEFIPSLDEGDIALHAMRIEGTSLEQAVSMQKKLENALQDVPEIKRVFSKIGTAEIATDPMPPNIADTFIILKEKEQWPDPSLSKNDLVTRIQEEVSLLPGNNYEFTQPIQMRFNELISGVRADVAVKVFGDDHEQLLKSANDIYRVLSSIQGAEDVKVEQTTGLPVMSVDINREALARFGLNMTDVQNTVQLAIGGLNTGEVYQGDKRFDIVIRLPEELRQSLEAIRQLPIAVSDSTNQQYYIPLHTVADIATEIGPSQISRENGKRRIVISANVRERDLGSFVDAAQKAITEQVTLPSGYWLGWGGQFEQLLSASERLMVVVPLTLLIILVLLFMTFGNLTDGLLAFSGVPFAITGGILALWLRDIPLSISAIVGFIALSGVAVLNGLVLISFIKNLLEQNNPIDTAVTTGATVRLRPVLMTALVASLGFIPMALATGTGAEVQRPLATVVIGGIISSTLLTLLVLPVFYRLVYQIRHKPPVSSNSIAH